ncbi:MAG: Gfo/Idh/MocA family oxidoreductase [Planctomycetes bacterium]|nr:Gfo/Idh/MocA family oxidoreductase [Planctomycetota bacterium]
MGRTIGFGILGLGMGAARAKTVAATEGARLAAVCDLDADRLGKAMQEHQCRGFSSFEEMLRCDEVEVVYVMTPSGTHARFGSVAAAAGKHVITTKPMDLTTRRCDQLIEACERGRVRLVIDFESRYYPAMRQLKTAIEAGELGDLIMGEARCKWWRSQNYYDAMGGWRGTWKLDGGGALANQCIHLIDAVTWMCGPVRKVTAQIGTYGHRIEAEDLGMAILEFESGAAGFILATTTYALNNQFGIEVHGKLGSATTVPNWHEIQVAFADGRTALATPRPEGPPRNAVEDMVAALMEDRPPCVSGQEGRRSIQLLEQIYEAAGVGEIRRQAIGTVMP